MTGPAFLTGASELVCLGRGAGGRASAAPLYRTPGWFRDRRRGNCDPSLCAWTVLRARKAEQLPPAPAGISPAFPLYLAQPAALVEAGATDLRETASSLGAKSVGEPGASQVLAHAQTRTVARAGPAEPASARTGPCARRTAAFVGIDVSKRQLDVFVRPTGEHRVVAHDDGALPALIQHLVGLRPALVVLEATGGWMGKSGAARPGAREDLLRSSLVWLHHGPDPDRRTARARRAHPP